jgi:dihydroorotase
LAKLANGMNLLIRNATVVDPGSPHNGRRVDIYISRGRIEAIQPELGVEGAEIWEAKGAFVSPGWMDIGVQTGDPGFEHREDLHSAMQAAAAGGFTAIATQPNTQPVMHSKSEVQYIRNATRGNIVDCYPLGAISRDCQGKDITEMVDMHRAGAIAFSDGDAPVQNGGLMLRALQYVKVFDGVIINHPQEAAVAGRGQMHEGLVSTSLGLKGIPALAEELMVQRDINLLEYADSRLHIANISTAEAVRLIRRAKEKGLKVTASVPVMNLAFDDSVLHDFDPNYKVLPPLRSPEHIAALKEGLRDGVIDLISSNHVPLEEDTKKLEFPFAEFGAIGLQTAFALANRSLEDILKLEALVEKLAILPRRIFGLEIPVIEKGRPANLTLFDPTAKWTFQRTDILSKSENTPLIGMELKGKVLGIVNHGRHFFVGSV